MSTTKSTAILETLPAELFNHVLGYVFDPEECEIKSSDTQFPSYCFETSLLRVSRGINQLAKNYLHSKLSWLRFDINWGKFYIDPRNFGIIYVNIDREKPEKSILQNPLESPRRSVSQDVPDGRFSISITFPHACTTIQEAVNAIVKKDTNVSMSILILERDLAEFVRVLRINDFAYCHRVLPDTFVTPTIRARPGLDGIKSRIIVHPGQQTKQYGEFVAELKRIWSPLHRTKIVGHEDNALAATIAGVIEHQHAYTEQQELGLTTAEMSSKLLTSVSWEGVGHALWLKHQGDEWLRQGQDLRAYLCYRNRLEFEAGWLMVFRPPAEESIWAVNGAFLWERSAISMEFNSAIAYLAGGSGRKRTTSQSPKCDIFRHYTTPIH